MKKFVQKMMASTLVFAFVMTEVFAGGSLAIAATASGTANYNNNYTTQRAVSVDAQYKAQATNNQYTQKVSASLGYASALSSASVQSNAKPTRPYQVRVESKNGSAKITWIGHHADHYDVYIYGGNPPKVTRNQKVTRVPYEVNLTQGSYRVWVRGVNQRNGRLQYSSWSSPISFGVTGGQTGIPKQPQITGPHGTVVTTNPTLSWTEDRANTSRYEVVVRNSLNQIVYQNLNVRDNQVRVTTNLTNGVYRMQVRGISKTGKQGEWSRLHQFNVSVSTPLPAKPVISSPKGNTFAVRPTIQWNKVNRATYYEMVVTKASGEIVIHERQLHATHYIPRVDLALGGYKIKVRAYNSARRAGAWSDEVSFNVVPRSMSVQPTRIFPSQMRQIFNGNVQSLSLITLGNNSDSQVSRTNRGLRIGYNTNRVGFAGGGVVFPEGGFLLRSSSKTLDVTVKSDRDLSRAKLELNQGGRRLNVFLNNMKSGVEHVFQIPINTLNNMGFTALDNMVLVLEGAGKTGSIELGIKRSQETFIKPSGLNPKLMQGLPIESIAELGLVSTGNAADGSVTKTNRGVRISYNSNRLGYAFGGVSFPRAVDVSRLRQPYIDLGVVSDRNVGQLKLELKDEMNNKVLVVQLRDILVTPENVMRVPTELLIAKGVRNLNVIVLVAEGHGRTGTMHLNLLKDGIVVNPGVKTRSNPNWNYVERQIRTNGLSQTTYYDIRNSANQVKLSFVKSRSFGYATSEMTIASLDKPDVSPSSQYAVHAYSRRCTRTSSSCATRHFLNIKRTANGSNVATVELRNPSDGVKEVRFEPGKPHLVRVIYRSGIVARYDGATGKEIVSSTAFTDADLEKHIREVLLPRAQQLRITVVRTPNHRVAAHVVEANGTSVQEHVFVYDAKRNASGNPVRRMHYKPRGGTLRDVLQGVVMDDTGTILALRQSTNSSADKTPSLKVFKVGVNTPLRSIAYQSSCTSSFCPNESSVKIVDNKGALFTVEVYPHAGEAAAGTQLTLSAVSNNVVIQRENRLFIPAAAFSKLPRIGKNRAFVLETKQGNGGSSGTTNNYHIYRSNGQYVTTYTKNRGFPFATASTSIGSLGQPDASPDNQYLIHAFESWCTRSSSGCARKAQIQVKNASNGSNRVLIQLLDPRKDKVSSVRFDVNKSREIIVTYRSGLVKRYDAATGKEIVVNVVPRTPVVTGPASLVTTQRPTITWQGDAHASRYHVFIRNTRTGKVIQDSNVRGASYVLKENLIDGSYQVYVRAFNSQGSASSWSRSRAFNVKATSPSNPVEKATRDYYGNNLPSNALIKISGLYATVSYKDRQGVSRTDRIQFQRSGNIYRWISVDARDLHNRRIEYRARQYWSNGKMRYDYHLQYWPNGRKKYYRYSRFKSSGIREYHIERKYDQSGRPI